MILRNLLENAVQATDSGSITVRLDTLEVSVQDTGRGMDPELIARVTDSFVSGAPSRGFGLGLAIVQRLASAWTGD